MPPDIAESISPHRAFDHRPYELIWADRKEEEEPLVSFERLMGWTAESSSGAEVSFTTTDDKQLWGQHVGVLKHSGGIRSDRVVVRPPQPIPIRDRCNSVDLWVFGPHTVAPGVSNDVMRLGIDIVDAQGSTYRLPLGRVDWYGWSLIHHVLERETLEQIQYPCRMTGIIFENVDGLADVMVYLDSLSFYTERLPSLLLGPRPAPNMPREPGRSVGLHEGPGVLPFPVRPNTILPPTLAPAYSNAILSLAGDRYALAYYAGDGRLSYTFAPTSGLGSLVASWNGRRVGRVLTGAGVTGLGEDRATPTVVRVEGQTLHVAYDSGVACQLSITGKVLVVDVSCRGREATGLTLGRMTELQEPRLLSIPFLTAPPGPSPQIGMMKAGGEAEAEMLFASVWLDPYRSAASAFYVTNDASPTELVLNGGSRYSPTTAGRRNDLFERVLVCLSPRVEAVLPVIPNPRGARAGVAAERILQWTEGPQDYRRHHEESAAVSRLGLDQVLESTGRSIWQDDYDSYALRTRAAPRRGGEHELTWYVGAQQSLGWLLALYANYYDLSPLNRHWSSQAVQRLADGRWRKTSPGCYALKPAQAVEWQAELTSAVKTQFLAGALFIDGITDKAPWRSTDADARLAGAGEFVEALYDYGELLRSASDTQDGPVLVPDGYHWFYAGLSDAHVGTPAGSGVQAGRPFNPVFALYRLAPLEPGYGLGDIGAFFGDRDDWRSDVSAAADEYLAAEIAYGRAGRLFPPELGYRQVARSYFLMQQLQQRYLLHEPRRLSYWTGTTMKSSSEAFASGAFERSQLYLNFPGDLEVWVNGSASDAWDIRVGADSWTLPPHGWLATGPEFFELSALADGHRVDYVSSPVYTFYDGRGAERPFKHLAASGPITLKWIEEEGAPQLEVRDLAAVGRFAWADPEGIRIPVRCATFSANGSPLPEATLSRKDDLTWVSGPSGALRYVISFAHAEEAKPAPTTDAPPAP